MSVDFTRYTNLGADAGVVAVKIGSSAPILEVELNEAQEIQRQALKGFIRKHVGDGIAGKGTMTYAGGNFTIANEVAYVAGEVLDIASMTVAAINGDSIYLDVYEAEATSATTLKAAGNVSGTTVTNYLIDSRVGSETSRRIVRWVTLAKTTGVAGHSYLKLGTITAGAFVPNLSPAPNLQAVYSTGAANAYVGALPSATGYFKGMFLMFTATVSNTGASTLSLNSLGNKNIMKFNSGALVALEADDITANNPVLLYYDGTQFLNVTSYTPSSAALLAKLLLVDGAGSGLDSDKLDGQEGSYYLNFANLTNKPDPVITLTGDATGSVTLTDLASGSLAVTVVDNSHNHTMANVTGLDTALAAKAPLASPALTGTPTAPTATVGNSTTQLATTAFVNAEIAADAAPIGHVGATGAAHGVATGSVAGFMSPADYTKLAGIAPGATGAMTAAEILTAIKTVDGAGSGLDADLLGGIASAGFNISARGSASFTSGLSSINITNAFCTANSLVHIAVTGTSAGDWEVNSAAGSFTITSTVTEPSSVPFDYKILKAVSE